MDCRSIAVRISGFQRNDSDRRYCRDLVFGGFWNELGRSGTEYVAYDADLKEDIIFILLNFPTPGLLLFFAGLAALYKHSVSRPFACIISALLILFFLFAFRYTVPDRYAFFIPFYVMVSILIGVGFYHYVLEKKYRTLTVICFACAFLPIAVYAAAPHLAEKGQFQIV